MRRIDSTLFNSIQISPKSKIKEKELIIRGHKAILLQQFQFSMLDNQKNAFNRARIIILISLFLLTVMTVIYISLFLRVERTKQHLQRRMAILEV